MNRSEQIDQLAAALAKAQGAMRNPRWDAKNPQFSSKYATLGTVIDAARAPLADNGLSILQTTNVTDGGIYLESTLLHISGQWVSSTYPVRPMRQVKNEGWVPAEDPQSIGSALSYARRYSLEALIDIAEDDDDGNKASEHQPAAATRPQATAPAPRPVQQPERIPPHTIHAVEEADALDEAKRREVQKQPNVEQGERVRGGLLKAVDNAVLAIVNGKPPEPATATSGENDNPGRATKVAVPTATQGKPPAPATAASDTEFVALPKAPGSASADAPEHWIENEATRRQFFAWVSSQGMKDEEVYIALNNRSLHEYAGSKQDAKNAILAYLKAKFAAQAQREPTALSATA